MSLQKVLPVLKGQSGGDWRAVQGLLLIHLTDSCCSLVMVPEVANSVLPQKPGMAKLRLTDFALHS